MAPPGRTKSSHRVESCPRTVPRPRRKQKEHVANRLRAEEKKHDQSDLTFTFAGDETLLTPSFRIVDTEASAISSGRAVAIYHVLFNSSRDSVVVITLTYGNKAISREMRDDRLVEDEAWSACLRSIYQKQGNR